MFIGKSNPLNFDPLCQVSWKPISKLISILSQLMMLEQAGENKFEEILDKITQQYDV